MKQGLNLTEKAVSLAICEMLTVQHVQAQCLCAITAVFAEFPEVKPGQRPYGGRVMIQLRRIKKTAGRIIIVDETKENEKWNNMIGKVVAVGPLAFKNRDTMQPWPEGDWCKKGEFVRVPKYGGDRWEVAYVDADGEDQNAMFCIFNDLDIIGQVTGDPLSVRAFI